MNFDILLYAGEGTDPGKLVHALARDIAPGRHRIVAAGAREIVENDRLFHNAALLIMPGGADLPYCRDLNGAGTAAIRRFVETGGSYLGLCAGGYFGAARLAFHEGRPDEIAGPRELAFFPGIARGPIEEFGGGYDGTKASASTPLVQPAEGPAFAAYYNGGCRFVPDEPVESLARYETLPEKPAAAVRMAIGKGQAVLCGIHPEVSAEVLRWDLADHADRERYMPLVEALQRTEAARDAFWKGLLGRCGVCTT